MTTATQAEISFDRDTRMNQGSRRADRFMLKLRAGVIGVSLAALGACATPPPPPVAVAVPIPKPKVEPIPARPAPPGGASYVMNIPERGPDGQRKTVHRALSEDETVWHFRSGWNVAALNCMRPEHAPILTAYSAFIKDHARALKRVNDRIDRQYRQQMGARRAGIIEREGVMTSVYNFFALPPARVGFCDAALDISQRAMATPPSDPIAFATDNFDQLEAPFNNFFDEYEAYQQASAEWDAKYGARYGQSQPGYAAVQQARAEGKQVPSVQNLSASYADPQTAGGDASDGQGSVDATPGG